MQKKGYPTHSTVAIIKGMVARGDRQMDVAVFHGLNQARINELVNGTGAWGKAFKHIVAAEPETLPESGPYAVVGKVGYDKLRVAASVPLDLLQKIAADLDAIKKELRNGRSSHV